MKRCLLLAIALSATPAVRPPEASDEPAREVAFLNVINLVALPSPTRISLGPLVLQGGEPLALGESSGLLAIQPGHYPLLIENEAAHPPRLRGTLDLAPGASVAVVCYADLPEANAGEKGAAKLRYQLLVHGNEKEPRLSLISLLEEAFVGVEVSGTSYLLERRQIRDCPVKLGDSVQIVHKGRVLAEWEVAKIRHDLGFLYRAPGKETVKLAWIRQERLSYHPPLKEGQRP